MRLNKYLAQSGVASRRESDRLIQEGTVTVNGQVMIDPAYQAQENDEITFDGKVLTPQEGTVVYMLNKPKNVITTARDEYGRKTVMDLIPSNRRLFPIGRLDKDTTGIILITDNGELANYLMHPKNRVSRFYEAEIEGQLNPKEIAKIKKGIFIGDGEFGRGEIVKQVTRKTRSTITIRLQQGKKREIRRIFYSLGKIVYSLHRFQYGTMVLGNLQPGQWRGLMQKEVKSLTK
ncbi:MAG: rRNA pseudouridine synthase [Candidatus Marinimicrobia bacterium]|nr:rRNA pseudouridine synthase [Candidatus Neomarinimicrobiota bacterium]